jgi:phosphoribosyl 1,2-cyclic phosphate phosphodiesterase
MGIPQIGCDCTVCRSEDPRDRRTRAGALLSTRTASILIDTPPELRLRLLAASAHQVDAVLYTHGHADHVHGIDDLRTISLARPGNLPVYGSASTIAHIKQRFNYIFDEEVVPVRGTSKPRLTATELTAGERVTLAGFDVLPLAFEHGSEEVFGYRIGKIAYITDVKSVPEEAIAMLRGVQVLVLSALWWRPHPTHLSIEEAVEVARSIGAERTYLTHLTHETAHRQLLSRLPPGIEPGYDGLGIEI